MPLAVRHAAAATGIVAVGVVVSRSYDANRDPVLTGFARPGAGPKRNWWTDRSRHGTPPAVVPAMPTSVVRGVVKYLARNYEPFSALT